jgi:hypothetical protein
MEKIQKRYKRMDRVNTEPHLFTQDVLARNQQIFVVETRFPMVSPLIAYSQTKSAQRKWIAS